ncbi:MAG: hypothetical protein FWD27_08435 [Coriobacteriia bacterium]|nr:hypothetical protein [Coriobacteriia bacterium]
MSDTAEATLTKWGNSQGFIIPRHVCAAANFRVGDCAIINVDDKGRIVLDHKKSPRYARRRVVSIEELSSGWQGGKAGEEWCGSDVGAEVVE